MLAKLIDDKVLKFGKSIDSNELQPENIELISDTEETSIFDKLIDFNKLQPENIEFILCSFELFKFNKLISFNELQPENRFRNFEKRLI